jgi:hypothetical protein
MMWIVSGTVAAAILASNRGAAVHTARAARSASRTDEGGRPTQRDQMLKAVLVIREGPFEVGLVQGGAMWCSRRHVRHRDSTVLKDCGVMQQLHSPSNFSGEQYGDGGAASGH